MAIPLCNHQFSDNSTCRSVALRGLSHCQWHRTENERLRRSERIEGQPRRRSISLTISRHPNVAQHNIQQVIDAMLADRISNKRAGLLLYALSNNIYS